MGVPTTPPPAIAPGPPICWPHAPGSLALRRAGRGTVDVISPAGRIVAAAVSEPVARVVADYARCRAVADRVAANEAQQAAILRDLPPFAAGEPDPCPAAELDAADRALLLAYSGNPIWSHPGVTA